MLIYGYSPDVVPKPENVKYIKRLSADPEERNEIQ